MQVLTVFIPPDFFRVISVIEKNGGGVPVEFFLRHERPTLKDQDSLASLR
jgi:hypothetical protein